MLKLADDDDACHPEVRSHPIDPWAANTVWDGWEAVREDQV
jgi:hypothetical protein